MLKVRLVSSKAFGVVKRLPSILAIGLIMFYRACISPLFPSCCRFVPSCSEYGLIAFRRFGFRKGFVLTAKRLSKCHPGGPYGYDPVPFESDSQEAVRTLEGKKHVGSL